MQAKTWNLEPNGKFLKQSPDFKMKEKTQLRSQMNEIWRHLILLTSGSCSLQMALIQKLKHLIYSYSYKLYDFTFGFIFCCQN